MNIQQFLEHHGVSRNPFAEEDAQTDPVFKDHCIANAYHPTWDKIYGDPSEPATSIVFGEKGAGKTAVKLQVARHIEQHNQQQPDKRLFLIYYDDFNPFLDRFRNKVGGKKPEKILRAWKLWDHMDAILSLAVTGLADRILQVKHPSTSVSGEVEPSEIKRLDRHQARDLLLLAACYDQSTSGAILERWQSLAKKLRFSTWKSYWPAILGAGWTFLGVVTMITLMAGGWVESLNPLWLYLLILAAGWGPWVGRFWKCFWKARGVRRRMRVGNREPSLLRSILFKFSSAELASQPLPNKAATDDRYEMLLKLQSVLETLGFNGVVVLMDRLDEPHLINGREELMKALLWPMLDNKFLKHPGMGLKILAPIELTQYVEREDRDFYQRSRLDKQNMIRSFEWTGEALYDVANARLQACAAEGASPQLRSFLEEGLSDQRLIDAMRGLRTPRHLFKFLYRLFVSHCNSYADVDPVWKISPQTFEASLALYSRDQEAFERGLGAG